MNGILVGASITGTNTVQIVKYDEELEIHFITTSTKDNSILSSLTFDLKLRFTSLLPFLSFSCLLPSGVGGGMSG